MQLFCPINFLTYDNLPKFEGVKMLETFEFNEKEMNNQDESGNRIRSIIRGVVKQDLLKRLERQEPLFPMTHKKSLYYINFYIIQKNFNDAPKKIKDSILANAKAVHTKEMHRIRKAFLTLRKNIATETAGMEIDKNIYEKIYKYIVYQWLKKEFYITKTEIRRYVFGFSVFFKELKPIQKKNPKNT